MVIIDYYNKAGFLTPHPSPHREREDWVPSVMFQITPTNLLFPPPSPPPFRNQTNYEEKKTKNIEITIVLRIWSIRNQMNSDEF